MPAGPIGSVWASGSWSNTAWEANTWADAGAITAPTELEDLNTVLIPHLAVLYAATPGDDVNTLWARDVPVIRADADSLDQDLNTDVTKYLS